RFGVCHDVEPAFHHRSLCRGQHRAPSLGRLVLYHERLHGGLRPDPRHDQCANAPGQAAGPNLLRQHPRFRFSQRARIGPIERSRWPRDLTTETADSPKLDATERACEKTESKGVGPARPAPFSFATQVIAADRSVLLTTRSSAISSPTSAAKSFS